MADEASASDSIAARPSSHGQGHAERGQFLLLRNIVNGTQPVTEAMYTHLGVKRANPRDDYEWDESVDMVGRGGFASVYKARQCKPMQAALLHRVRSVSTAAPSTDGEVAIKIINQEGVTEEDMNKLWREVAVMRMLAKTPSPSTSTLPLFAAYLYERRLYLVLRYCAGGSIRAGESWKEGDVACVAESILLGLRTMHQLGCVHHDIKPDNLLLMDGGSPPSIVIADYGTSLIIDERGKGLIATGGTPGYAPPEWMGGECDYSTASDVFATGVTVTVLLAAAFPFNFEKVYEKVMAGAKGYKLDPELVRLDEKSTGFKRIMSEGAKDFVRKCCAFDPEDRWTVEQLLDHEWLLRYGRGKGGGRALSFLASEINSVLKRMELGTAVEHGLRRGAAASDIADPAAVEVIRQKHIQENALRAEFHKLVSEGNELKLPEFKVMMARLGCDHLLLDRLFGAFDSDDSGGISLPELIVGLGLLRQTEPHKRAELVLRMYSDADGFITVAGITDALQSVAHRYSNHPMFKASETRMKEVLIELCGESREGRVASADLKEAIMGDRRLLRLFLAPAAAVHEKDRLERESEEWGWAVSAFGEASVTNWHRSIYLVLLLFVTVTLLMHFVGVLDVDAVGSWLMRQLVRASDAMGAVDGDGGSAGDLDFVMDASGTAAVDVA